MIHFYYIENVNSKILFSLFKEHKSTMKNIKLTKYIYLVNLRVISIKYYPSY